MEINISDDFGNRRFVTSRKSNTLFQDQYYIYCSIIEKIYGKVPSFSGKSVDRISLAWTKKGRTLFLFLKSSSNECIRDCDTIILPFCMSDVWWYTFFKSNYI